MPYLEAMLKYLYSSRLAGISDTALARISSQYGTSNDGYAQEIVAIIAEEQARRRQVESVKVLRWARIGAWAAIAAALASLFSLIK